MNDLINPLPIKDRVWTVEGKDYVRITTTPGEYDLDAPLFFGNSMATRDVAKRFADCMTAFVGVDDPMARMSELLQLEARWKAITEAPARTVALLGDGVGSVLHDHPDAVKVAATYDEVQNGPAPWIVVECWPAPLLFLSADGIWDGSVEKAERHPRREVALDRAATYKGEVVSLSWVGGES